jgi:toxin ParE1/3/4
MRFQIVITDEAEVDIGDAFRWYDEQQVGLGTRFVDAIGQRLAFIEQQALAITIVDHDIRRAVVSGFRTTSISRSTAATPTSSPSGTAAGIRAR